MSLAERMSFPPHLPRSTERKLVKAQHPRRQAARLSTPAPAAHEAPSAATLVRLAAPNVLVMVAQASRRADRNLFCSAGSAPMRLPASPWCSRPSC